MLEAASLQPSSRAPRRANGLESAGLTAAGCHWYARYRSPGRGSGWIGRGPCTDITAYAACHLGALPARVRWAIPPCAIPPSPPISSPTIHFTRYNKELFDFHFASMPRATHLDHLRLSSVTSVPLSPTIPLSLINPLQMRRYLLMILSSFANHYWVNSPAINHKLRPRKPHPRPFSCVNSGHLACRSDAARRLLP